MKSSSSRREIRCCHSSSKRARIESFPGNIADAGQFRGKCRSIEQYASMLQHCPLMPPLGAAGDFVIFQHHIAGSAALKAEKRLTF